MAKSSLYDELHDKYYNILSTKAGTRYERLAAVVFKKLNESGTVIHDLKLLGDSEVKHQIDIVIERSGQKRRLLVECKDFDISGASVGLGIVEKFCAVKEDIHPDEAYIVTCNDFTTDAQKFARAKGITLATLRSVTKEDLDGRILKVVLNMIIVTATTPQVTLGLGCVGHQAKFVSDLQKAGLGTGGIYGNCPVYIVGPNGRIQANDFIRQKMHFGANTAPGPQEQIIDVTGLEIEVENLGPIPLTGLQVKYEVLHTKETTEIGGDRVAVLLLQGPGDSDFVIWDEDLKRFSIDASSRVVTKSSTSRLG